MDFEYQPIHFDPQNGALTVWVYNAVHPQGEKLSIPTLLDDGTFVSSEAAIRSRIEAAIPVAWFEVVKLKAEKDNNIGHITAMLGRKFKCTRTPQQQGQSLQVGVLS